MTSGEAPSGPLIVLSCAGGNRVAWFGTDRILITDLFDIRSICLSAFISLIANVGSVFQLPSINISLGSEIVTVCSTANIFISCLVDIARSDVLIFPRSQL